MNLYYAPHIDSLRLPTEITLSEEESYHCVRVMRMNVSDHLHVTDGNGNLYKAEILYNHPKICLVSLTELVQKEMRRPYRIHLAVAPTKNIERFEWFLEKATEIGIDEITPLLCEHSERTKLRTDRLEKILVSAMKQSQNLYLPELHELVKFNDFARLRWDEQKFIAYVEERQDTTLIQSYKKGSNCTILVGPEGDFSKAEVEKAIENGYQMVSLGNSRLRTETAAIVATHTIHVLNMKEETKK